MVPSSSEEETNSKLPGKCGNVTVHVIYLFIYFFCFIAEMSSALLAIFLFGRAFVCFVLVWLFIIWPFRLFLFRCLTYSVLARDYQGKTMNLPYRSLSKESRLRYFQTLYPVLPLIVLAHCLDVFLEDQLNMFSFVLFQSKVKSQTL